MNSWETDGWLARQMARWLWGWAASLGMDGEQTEGGREGGRDRWMHGWMDGETTS